MPSMKEMLKMLFSGEAPPCCNVAIELVDEPPVAAEDRPAERAMPLQREESEPSCG